MDRRQLVAGLALSAGGLMAGCAHVEGEGDDSPRFAVTIDDFRVLDGPLLSGGDRHGKILGALEAAGLQAAGFPAGKFIDNAAAREHLATWSAAGHLIGNHTYTHSYYGGASPGDLGADIDQAAPLVSVYPTSRPLFRFPYLAEGRTFTSREAMRDALRDRGLANAHVTIDASDWYVDQRLVERLQREPDADIGPYRAFYIRHLLERASFYDALARDLLGYSPPHSLLIHHNLATALFLSDALEGFRSAGWRAIDAETAFAHPVYASQPDITPASHSLIWQLAKADGRFEGRLRSPGEDGAYEKPAMDALGL